jgi:replicative DNA helicase
MMPPEASLWGASLRQPPANLQAEQALLGALLANNKAYDRVGEFLKSEHFADRINGLIYEAIGRRIDAGRLADVVTLKVDFEQSGVLDEVGGIAYLAQLLAAMVGIINAGEYGRAIRDAWLRRELVDRCTTAINLCHGTDAEMDGAAILEALETELYALAETGGAEGKMLPAAGAMEIAIEAAAKASQQPGGLTGITTGYRALDDLTGGLRGGHLVLIGARPSMGKTTLGLGIAAGAAQAGGRVLFLSAEMTLQDIGAALTAGVAGLPRDATERGRVRQRDALGRWTWPAIDVPMLDRMTAAQRAMAPRELLILEQRGPTLASLRAAARRLKRRGGLDLIVVDYLGLMRVPELERTGNAVAMATALSKGLKGLAMELEVPVIALAQLNRAVESREEKRPMLADLRDSGSLEQDADAVMFLFREHYYLRTARLTKGERESEEGFSGRIADLHGRTDASIGRAEVIVAKMRRGRTGIANLKFDDDSAWFADVEEG